MVVGDHDLSIRMFLSLTLAPISGRDFVKKLWLCELWIILQPRVSFSNIFLRTKRKSHRFLNKRSLHFIAWSKSSITRKMSKRKLITLKCLSSCVIMRTIYIKKMKNEIHEKVANSLIKGYN